jgi:hypothetical protein
MQWSIGQFQSTKLTSRHFDKNAYSQMNVDVELAMQLLSQSIVEMICYAIADNGILLRLHNKDMYYNHVADLCEHWNKVLGICNKRHSLHSPGVSPGNAGQLWL